MISNTEKEKNIFRIVGIYYISKYELKQLFSLIYVSITANAFKRLRVVTHYNKKSANINQLKDILCESI